MEFHARSQAFTGHELAELVAIAPDDAAMKAGFRLQDPEVDDVVRAARDLEAGRVQPDTARSDAENVQLLLRAGRLLQLGLEVQFAEGDALLAENNGLRDDLRALEEQNRSLDEEVRELRELRDREGSHGDVRELELELQELRRAYEDERKANDRLIQQSDRDKQAIDGLQDRLARGQELLQRKEDEALELREQLGRLRDDFDELRGQAATLTAQGQSREQQREIGETLRQQQWKIEQLSRDNRALEAANVELRAQLDALREENLQVSEKILLLDGEARQLRLAAAAADDRAELLGREKGAALSQVEALRSDVAAKMALLEEFEERFARQYRSWEEERASLTSQVDALRKEARLYVSSRSRAVAPGGSSTQANGSGAGDGGEEDDEESSPEAQLAALKRELDRAKENEVLLLEAYEQLEADVGAEVDRALARQAEELAGLSRRGAVLEASLAEERAAAAAAGEEVARLEGALADAVARNTAYEAGVYGLPQAAMEIRQLKEAVAAREARVKELVQQSNKLAAALEDACDEAALLRTKAGLPPGTALDTGGVKLQKDVTIAQLRSVNALLERQVSDLEEERRKLLLEAKFRAKYHGRAAAELGLSPEQLLLLDEFVEGLRGGRLPEERLVTQMQKRVEFLEVRLAEVMAYADIPISMRPALAELQASMLQASALPGLAALAATGAGQLGVLANMQHSGDGGADAAAAGSGSAAAVSGGIKATQVELVRGALLGCLKMLRQMSEALSENRQVSDAEYRTFTDSVIDKLMDAERVTTLLLRDISASTAAAAAAAALGGAVELGGASMQRRQQQFVSAGDVVADAAAGEMCERLGQLAKQVVDLQVLLAQKDAQLAHLVQPVSAGDTRVRQGSSDAAAAGSEGSGAAAADGAALVRRGGDLVPREQHEEVAAELCAVKEQLLECLEELDARERELGEVSTACLRYQSSMAGLSEQVKMLYRDYADQAASWRMERSTTDKQLKQAQAAAKDASAQAALFDDALKRLEAGDHDDIKRQYVDAVRKAAVVQLKHAKLARQLQACSSAEKAALERLEEVQAELTDCSATCRARMRWLQQAADDATRRTQQLCRALQNTAPLEAYQALLEKHSQLAREHRLLLEQAGDAAAGDEAEQLLSTRQQLAELLPRYDAALDEVVQLREMLRQLELPAKLAGRHNATFLGPQQPAAAAAADAATAPPTAPATPAATLPPPVSAPAAEQLHMCLNQDLVAAVVQLEGLQRRLEMAEREKERASQSLAEAQAHAAELQQRLAQVSSELTTSRSLEGRLQARLAASVPAAEHEAMAARLELAEAAAACEQGAAAAAQMRAEEAERKLAALTAQRQHALADITNLRTAVRELSSSSDAAAALGKLHGELDHARAKESLARGSLARCQQERLELERQLRALKGQAGSLAVQLAAAQDHARWAESELLDALCRLELGLAGHVEGWKAARWASKLEQLKRRNDRLAAGLEAATARLAKLEDASQEATLRAELLEDVRTLLARGGSDVAREAAALKEQQLVLKLESGKLNRGQLLLRQKVAYLEAVNAELCEMLEAGDVDAAALQGGLTAEKRELTARMRALQEEVVRLHERCSSLLAEVEELKSVRGSSSKAALTAAGASAAAGSTGGSAAAAGVGTAADKELLLKQIDCLKEARTEAEHMRQEVRRLEGDVERRQLQLEELQGAYDDVLERLKGQSASLVAALGTGAMAGGADDVLSQLRSVAEAAVGELQGRLRDREARIAELAAQLQEHQAAYLAQHAKDRAEIEALTAKLYESGAASIAGLKATLARSAALAVTGDGQEVVPYEQLQLLLEERTAELEATRHRLEQAAAGSDAMRRSYEAQAQRQEAEIARLSAALAAVPKQDASASRTALAKLSGELRTKDARLRQLRGAIKTLEGKLAQLLKDRSDIAMQASSWLEQEQLDERLAELEAQKAELYAQLQEAQAELLAARLAAAAAEAAARRTGEQLAAEAQAAAALRAELAHEQAAVKGLKAKLQKVASQLPEGGQQLFTQLQQQVSELEADKRQLAAELSRQAAYVKALRAGGSKAGGRQGAASSAGGTSSGSSQHGADAAAAGGGSHGLKPLRTQGSLGSLVLPVTPGGGDARPTGAAAALLQGGSSDGGGRDSSSAGRKSSRLGSGSGGGGSSETGAAAPGSSLSGDGEAAASAGGGGVSYAPAQWEEGKQLQAKVESLRRKLAKKAEECDALTKECERRSVLVAALSADKDRLAAGLAASQAKARKLAQDAAGSGPLPPRADASLLKEYVARVLQLEDDKDALQAQLQRLTQQQQDAAAGAGAPPEQQQQQLAEVQLQKEQALAAAARLRQHLLELFGPDAAADGAASSSGTRSASGGGDAAPAAGGSSRALQRVSSAGGSSAGGRAAVKLTGREAELLTIVDNLKAALGTAMACSTPTSRYTQELQQRKAAQKEVQQLQAQLDRLRPQLAAATAQCDELAAANAELRAAAGTLKQQLLAGGESRVAAGARQQQQQQLAQQEAEAARLRRALADAQRQLVAAAAASPAGSSDAAAAAAAELATLRQRVAVLQQENGALRHELAALDPAFFDEIEELKLQHAQLLQRCAAQQRLISQLQQGLPSNT